jgi:hypothetical protein
MSTRKSGFGFLAFLVVILPLAASADVRAVKAQSYWDPTAQKYETVIVPNLPAPVLLAVVKEEVGLTELDPVYAKRGFLRNERGKTYEAVTWDPGFLVTTDAVREHFDRLGFGGNTAAFLEWIKKDRGDGWFVTIPDDRWLFHDAGRRLYVPCFLRSSAPDDSIRSLRLNETLRWWYRTTFVAFREIRPH